MHKIGDKVLASFPNSCLTIGGTVLMVITVTGKPTQYCVKAGGLHTMFDEAQVKIK